MAVTMTFEHRGFPVELVTRRDIERAVSSGRLAADTLVNVAEVGQKLRVMRARDVDVLKPFLEPPAEALEPVPVTDGTATVGAPSPPRPWASLAGTVSSPPAATPSGSGVGKRSGVSIPAPEPLVGSAADADGTVGLRAYAMMPLRRYADFSGRSSRREFWSFGLALAVLVTAVELTAGGTPGGGSALAVLVLLGLGIPACAVTVRRLHDCGTTGWVVLCALIPYIGTLLLLIAMVLPGAKTSNSYGDPPSV